MSYAVKSIFLTVQGEGWHAGRRAIFVRLAGCNVWSGREEDRAKDVTRGCCAAWCDTDFRGTDGPGGGRLSATSIAERVLIMWGGGPAFPFVVISGGEPSLQVDGLLVSALHRIGAYIAVETNGLKALPSAVDWVTLSPKPPSPVCDQPYNEVKVVVPAVNPLLYAHHAPPNHRFVQALDHGPMLTKARMDMAEKTGIVPEVPFRPDDAALQFVMEHPEWRLSIQTHKVLGVP